MKEYTTVGRAYCEVPVDPRENRYKKYLAIFKL